MEILKMDRSRLMGLQVEDIQDFLTPEEVVHIAKTLGAFWTYDYQAAAEDRVGMHAILKSGLHSDGFFISRIILAVENIRRVISAQMVMLLRGVLGRSGVPDYVAGVPDGATLLGQDIAEMLDTATAEMRKDDGRIVLVSQLDPGQSLLLVEDFCTRGTGFKEAVNEVRQAQPQAKILPYNPVIINRGGMESVSVDSVGEFEVLPVVKWRIQDWDPKEGCPLCDKGSVPIKPKASDANWSAITNSQQ